VQVTALGTGPLGGAAFMVLSEVIGGSDQYANYVWSGFVQN
jgi:hypothetical protein